MGYHDSVTELASPVEAGRQIAQLRHILGLVEQIAGRSPRGRTGNPGDENRICDGYERASPIVQRRFDALTMETAAWAAAGVQALLVAKATLGPPRAAAAGLADELDVALRKLSRMVEVEG
jgi:hypothetical protein